MIDMDAKRFLEDPDVQGESGLNTYYSRDLVLEMLDAAIDAALAAAPAQERIDALELEVRQLTEQIAELQKPYEKGKHMTPEQHAAAIEDAVEFYLNASIGMLHFVERVDLREFAKTARQELQAAIIAGVGAAPEGWQLVPVEPTNAMLDALEEGGCSEGNYKAALAAAPQPSPTPQADSQPAPLREGEWINDAGRIKWLMWRVQDLEAKLAARAPADSVTASAGEVDDDVDAIALARYKVVPAHESMFHRFAVVAGGGKQQLYLGREVECENMARKFAGAFLDGAFYQSNIAPAQTADSVLEDAARRGVEPR